MNESFFSRRIGRLKFLVYFFVATLLMQLLLALLIAIPNTFPGSVRSIIVSAFDLLIPFVWLMYFMILVVKRLHDMNLSGFYVFVLITLMILVGLVTLGFGALLPMILSLVYFGFKKGTSGPNRFGEDPLLKSQG